MWDAAENKHFIDLNILLLVNDAALRPATSNQ